MTNITKKETNASFLTIALLPLFSGILAVLAFPNWGFFFLAWFCLIPLLYGLSKPHKLKVSFLLGELFGIVYFYGTCYWITHSMIYYGELPTVVAHLLALILVSIVSIFPATFALLTNQIVRKFGVETLILAPIVWAAIEYLRLHVSGVGWNAFGYSQSFHPSLIWPSQYGGVFLVSALTVLPAASITLLFCKRTKLTVSLSIAALLICATIPLTSKLKTPSVSPKNSIKVVATQAVAPVNVPQSELTESLAKQVSLSLEGIEKLRVEENLPQSQPILVAWPEAPFDFAYDVDEGWRKTFAEFTKKYNVYLLFNGETQAQNGKGQHNSVVLIAPNGERVGQYNKIHLLPFGEYVPMRGYLPFISLIPALAGDYTPANKYNVIDIEGTKVGAFICFESVFPDITRETARAGATAFINVANDGWFGQTPISKQHLAHVIMRAVETNRPLLRVTNVGISAYISAQGQVRDETPLFQPAMRIWDIEKETNKLPLTFYTRFGDVFAFACIFVTLLLLLPVPKNIKEEKQ